MTDWTSIRVSQETRDRLADRQRNNDSHEDVIKRLLGDADDFTDRVKRLEDRVKRLEDRVSGLEHQEELNELARRRE